MCMAIVTSDPRIKAAYGQLERDRWENRSISNAVYWQRYRALARLSQKRMDTHRVRVARELRAERARKRAVKAAQLRAKVRRGQTTRQALPVQVVVKA